MEQRNRSVLEAASDSPGAWGPVAEQAAKTYQVGGFTTQPVGIGHALGDVACFWVESLRRLECVLPEEREPEAVREVISAVAASRDVWLVVPTRQLGRAHEVMRGVEVRLQGWWESRDGRIFFTGPEIP